MEHPEGVVVRRFDPGRRWGVESSVRAGYQRTVISRPSCGLLLGGLLLVSGLPGQVPLRDLEAAGQPYRAPRSGEGVRGSLFGDTIEVAPRDRRSVSAWVVGVTSAPSADDSTLPLGSLYFWEHADGSLLRASIAGVANELWYSRTAANGAEMVATFDSFSPPWASGELVDGEVADAEKLQWGYVRAGFGFGYRTQVAPFLQDNLFASDLIVEPGLLYFGRGDTTDPTYVLPESTFELRVRWTTRLDAVQRGILEIAHDGFALGADVTAGFRDEAEDWGLPANGLETAERSYFSATAYAFGITAVPGIDSDRHRLLASIHGGSGDDLDRFSATRIGGGPDMRGEEFGTSVRPWLPGAAYGEFFPEHYVIGSCGYRCELAFFAWLDLGTTVAWLDRNRQQGASVESQDDVLTALSARVSTGFLWRSRLQIGWGHCFDVVRDGERGGDDFTLLLTGGF